MNTNKAFSELYFIISGENEAEIYLKDISIKKKDEWVSNVKIISPRTLSPNLTTKNQQTTFKIFNLIKIMNCITLRQQMICLRKFMK